MITDITFVNLIILLISMVSLFGNTLLKLPDRPPCNKSDNAISCLHRTADNAVVYDVCPEWAVRTRKTLNIYIFDNRFTLRLLLTWLEILSEGPEKFSPFEKKNSQGRKGKLENYKHRGNKINLRREVTKLVRPEAIKTHYTTSYPVRFYWISIVSDG